MQKPLLRLPALLETWQSGQAHSLSLGTHRLLSPDLLQHLCAPFPRLSRLEVICSKDRGVLISLQTAQLFLLLEDLLSPLWRRGTLREFLFESVPLSYG